MAEVRRTLFGNSSTSRFARPNAFTQTKKDTATLAKLISPSEKKFVSDKKTKRKVNLPQTSSKISRQLNLPNKPLPITSKVTQKPVVVIDRANNVLKEIVPDRFNVNGEIVIKGEYPQNEISFDKFSFSDIKAFSSVSFQFILLVSDNSGQKYFTSKDFLNKLKSANKRNEPFLQLESLNPASVVRVDLRQSLNLIDELRALEEKEGTTVSFNTYINKSGTIDYQKLVEYIDWVVSKPSENYDDRIIPASFLSNYTTNDSAQYGNDDDDGGGTATPTNQQEDNVSPPEPEAEPEPITLNRYKPIGRAGNYIGEVVNNYRWGGVSWLPVSVSRTNVIRSGGGGGSGITNVDTFFGINDGRPTTIDFINRPSPIQRLL